MVMNPQSVVAAVVEAHDAWFDANVLAALEDSNQAEPIREEELVETY